MADEFTIRVQAHRQNIARYRSLLKTELTAIERAFIDRRIAEEDAAVRRLSATARLDRANRVATGRFSSDADSNVEDRLSPG